MRRLISKQASLATWPGTAARFFALALLPVLAVACGGSDSGSSSATGSGTAAPVKNVTFMAGFKPPAKHPFVGVYVAQEKGFFKAAGLNVDIRHAQSGEHLQQVLAGTVQFSTANGAQILARNDQGLAIESIALIGQKSEQGFAVGANSGISTI